jgi:hypothetical protein
MIPFQVCYFRFGFLSRRVVRADWSGGWFVFFLCLSCNDEGKSSSRRADAPFQLCTILWEVPKFWDIAMEGGDEGGHLEQRR